MESTASRELPDRMDREAIVRAAPVLATEPIPEELVREFSIANLKPKMGVEHSLISVDELADFDESSLDGDRPPWLDVTFLPRMAPRPISSRVLKSLSDRPLPIAALTPFLSAELAQTGWPWDTIGKVYVGTSADPRNARFEGTGVMVGRNVMLTASHLAPWEIPDGEWWMMFVPGERDGRGMLSASMVNRFRGIPTEGVDGVDIVVCQLDLPLGLLTGWMGWRWWADEDEYKDHPWTSVGYPGNAFNGRRPMIEPFCAIDDVDSDGDGLELETHPFTSDGWSGGPLFGFVNGQHRIVGICSGRETEFDLWEFFTKTHSVFSGGRRLGRLITYGQQNF